MEYSAPAKSWIWTSEGVRARHDVMRKPQEDQDLIDLARQLCTRASMTLEDTAAEVVQVGRANQRQLRSVVTLVRTQVARADILLAAAMALLDSAHIDRETQ